MTYDSTCRVLKEVPRYGVEGTDCREGKASPTDLYFT